MSEIPSADWSWVHATAERFERAWKKGPRPRIEDFLATVGETFWPPLLEELLRVENELRRSEGEEPILDDYRRRFPEHDELIASVFRAEPRQPPMAAGDEGLGLTRERSRGSPAGADALPAELANHPDYQIIRQLDRGGMGVVYLAHNRLLARDEVLKVMGRKIVDQPGVMDRFLREIRTVAKLRHPNIVSAYTAFRCGASLVFAMEYVVGLDLRRMVKARGAVPVGHGCSYVHQAALGLQHAHEEGLVHRDIKPGNLMLSHHKNRAVIKLLDFGLSKASSEQPANEVGISFSIDDYDSGSHLTCTGEMLGTPDFIAPEQIHNSQSADIRADIYSLGCTLHFLLAGKPPFPDMTLGRVLRAHRSQIPSRLDEIRTEVPSDLADLVAKMMAKDPAERFGEPADVADALTPFFKKRSVSARIAGFGPLPPGLEHTGAASGDLTYEALEHLVLLSAAGASNQAATKAAPENWSELVEIKDDDDEAAGEFPTLRPALDFVRPYWPLLAGAIGLGALLIAVVVWRIRGGSVRGNDADAEHVRAALAAAVTGAASSQTSGAHGDGPGNREDARLSGSLPEAKEANTRGDGPPAEGQGAKLAGGSQPSPSAVGSGKAKKQTGIAGSGRQAEARERKPIASPWRQRSPLGEQVASAIGIAVRFLKEKQRPDGSWTDVEVNAKTGMTSLAALALLSAGEKPDSPAIQSALASLRRFGPGDLRSTYAISLQAMVYSEAEPDRDQLRLAANVRWLEQAQYKSRGTASWPGTWTYTTPTQRSQPGDNSNSHWAVSALHAARMAGVPVRLDTWALARDYWEKSQKADGSWAYTPEANISTASMTCAGISSSIVSALHRPRAPETLLGATIRSCRQAPANRSLQAGINWLADHFHVNENIGAGQQWNYYYLCGLERAGRLAGIRYFGQHDWYREGATELVNRQNKFYGFWTGTLVEDNRVVATSFALLFLANGRAPVLINKLRHAPIDDWNNDADDVRNLVGVISRDRKTLLTSGVLDVGAARFSDLLDAPIAFFNGHRAPEFDAAARERLREYINKGGYILADACCASPNFDRGFKQLMKEVFAGESLELKPLGDDHPVWRAKHMISPHVHPLWGIEVAGRTAVFYSPTDLSCYWNQSERSPEIAAVSTAIKVGQNLIEYAIGRRSAPR